MKIMDTAGLKPVKEKGLKKILPGKLRLGVSAGTCSLGSGGPQVRQAFADLLPKKGLEAYLTDVGCFGFCSREPLVSISIPGQPLVFLAEIKPADVEGIVEELAHQRIPLKKILGKAEVWDHLSEKIIFGSGLPEISSWDEIPFFKGQKKIVLRNCGLINPEDIEEFIAVGGYAALAQALTTLAPEQIIEEIKKSKLRGRGGAGFPTGKKWEIIQSKKSDRKYIICNADEGDPGAFMNRNEIESDPHSLLEGMIIGAYAIGAEEGIIYIRAEYPLAVKRLKKAIEQAREYGLLGENILGRGLNFDLSVVEGAGAFVCGEETSLIESIEGKAGRPRARPPYPAEQGLWGKPTNINNVETWFNIPVITARGGEWFAGIGTEKSAGTKVFSLVGKIKNTGLVELPLGSTLDLIVNQIGQSAALSKKVKAVLTGGPSGGCIPAALFHSSVDYETLAGLGAIMGSGGMVVLDEDSCMVDVARYFTEFSSSESCGKCVPCREGLQQVLKIMNAITEGRAEKEDLLLLEELGEVIKDSVFCALGQTAPNPLLTTLKYFKDEYTAHVEEKRCPVNLCKTLTHYFIDPDHCQGCISCYKVCPSGAIRGGVKLVHIIDQGVCIKCGACETVCAFVAVKRVAKDKIKTLAEPIPIKKNRS
ncbi:MAG: NADH-quinone oxidoreductase subunit NuoF [Elusimicrobiota bacterium]